MPHAERTPSKNENLISSPSPLMGEGVGEGEPIVPLTSILSHKGVRKQDFLPLPGGDGNNKAARWKYRDAGVWVIILEPAQAFLDGGGVL